MLALLKGDYFIQQRNRRGVHTSRRKRIKRFLCARHITHTKNNNKKKKEEPLQCVWVRFNNLILETFMSKKHFDPQDILQACVKKEETLLFACRSPGDVIWSDKYFHKRKSGFCLFHTCMKRSYLLNHCFCKNVLMLHSLNRSQTVYRSLSFLKLLK